MAIATTALRWPRNVMLLAAVAIVAALACEQLLRAAPTTKPALAPSAPRGVTTAALRSLARSAGSSIFWAGPRAGDRYEFSHTTTGRFFVRYLPGKTVVGTETPELTIATYPVSNAYADVLAFSKRQGVETLTLNGGVAAYKRSAPGHIYMAYPGLAEEVEVYDPASGAAQVLVGSGVVVPVVGSVPTSATTSGSAPKTAPIAARSTARVTTPAQLAVLARTLGHPIYWAGPPSGGKLELTQSGGRVWLRYLPAGVAVGSPHEYLTIGTYPVPEAYGIVGGLAKAQGSLAVAATGGALAFYRDKKPTSVYAAYPTGNVEVEVFDPQSDEAHSVVTSGRLTAVPS